jgi:hypothetical protein|tara:strand:- start:383 stop:547 length:165 start_codon:yes stop_codon:yes gene_type:complete
MTIQTEELIKQMEKDKTIKIVIRKGIVKRVENVPEGFEVEIEDGKIVYEEYNDK